MVTKALLVLGPLALVAGIVQSSVGLEVVGGLWSVMGLVFYRYAKSRSRTGDEQPAQPGMRDIVSGAVLMLLAGLPALVVGIVKWRIEEPHWYLLPLAVGAALTALAVLSTALYALGSGISAVAGEPPTVPATLVVVSSEQTGTYINEMPRIEFVFDVTPNGGATYRVTKKATVPFTALGSVQPGGRFTALVVGQADPTNMDIDLASATGGTASADEPLADRLRELDKLRDQGLVSEAEHAEQRQRLLDSL